jgi:hypothetical protein
MVVAGVIDKDRRVRDGSERIFPPVTSLCFGMIFENNRTVHLYFELNLSIK